MPTVSSLPVPTHSYTSVLGQKVKVVEASEFSPLVDHPGQVANKVKEANPDAQVDIVMLEPGKPLDLSSISKLQDTYAEEQIDTLNSATEQIESAIKSKTFNTLNFSLSVSPIDLHQQFSHAIEEFEGMNEKFLAGDGKFNHSKFLRTLEAGMSRHQAKLDEAKEKYDAQVKKFKEMGGIITVASGNIGGVYDKMIEVEKSRGRDFKSVAPASKMLNLLAQNPDVVVVGSSSEAGKHHAFASRGEEMDFSAQGYAKDEFGDKVEGTSFSTPILAGKYNMLLNAGFSPDKATEILKNKAQDTSLPVEKEGNGFIEIDLFLEGKMSEAKAIKSFNVTEQLSSDSSEHQKDYLVI